MEDTEQWDYSSREAFNRQHIIINIDAPQHGNERLIACLDELVSLTGRR